MSLHHDSGDQEEIRARRSGGPRTEAGKARSSRNALKHGLRAKKYVFRDEDADAFQEYRIELIHELEPQGTMETFLADRLAQTMWRLRRIMPIEAEMLDGERETATGELCTLGQVFARPSFGGVKGVALVSRYETALQRVFNATRRELRIEQADRRAAEAESESGGWSTGPWDVPPRKPPLLGRSSADVEHDRERRTGPQPEFETELETELEAKTVPESLPGADTAPPEAVERATEPARRPPFGLPGSGPGRAEPANRGKISKRTRPPGLNGSRPGGLLVSS